MRFVLWTVLITLLLLTTGCISYESLINFGETNKNNLPPMPINNYQPLIIQKSDILQVNLSSRDAQSLLPFKMQGTENGVAFDYFQVSSDGNIEFPTIGKINVDGKLLEEARVLLEEKLSPYFEVSPIIQIKVTNFQVNVNGEVGSPGGFIVENGRINVYEAITRAGDFTDYSRRDSILVIRELDGMRTFGYLDFNSIEVYNSPFFYLRQNDMVYIQPSKAKVNLIRDPATRALPYLSAVVSVFAIILAFVRIF